MAFNSYEDTKIEKMMPWDLRQFRVQIISAHMIDIYQARKEKDYIRWYEAIDALETIVEHQLYEKWEDVNTQYQTIKDAVIKILIKNKKTYLGQSHNPQEQATIEEALKDFERWLYTMMQLAHVFGGFEYEPGL